MVALIINVVVLVALSSTAVKQVNAAATAPATLAATTEPVVDPTTAPVAVVPTTKPATTKPSPPPVKHTTAGPTVEEQNAIEAAQSYLSFTAFSRKGLIEQLESDAGEGFTHTQAVYGVTKAGL